MSELEQKLEGILGNPQAMAQIMSLAQSLNLGGPGSSAASEAQDTAQPSADAPSSPAAQPPLAPPAPPASATPPEGGLGGLGSLGGLLGGLSSLDPKMLSAAAELMGQFTSGDDDKRTALLTALRPFVKEQRYAKLDKAIQIARLSRLIRSGLDLFRSHREEGGNV